MINGSNSPEAIKLTMAYQLACDATLQDKTYNFSSDMLRTLIDIMYEYYMENHNGESIEGFIWDEGEDLIDHANFIMCNVEHYTRAKFRRNELTQFGKIELLRKTGDELEYRINGGWVRESDVVSLSQAEKFVFYNPEIGSYVVGVLDEATEDRIGTDLVIMTREEINDPIDDYFSEEMIAKAKELYSIIDNADGVSR